MPKDPNTFLIEEFTDARNRWADLRIDLMMRFGDQRTTIADRRFYLNIALISIAAAFLTIVVPLVGVNFSGDFNLATVFFFVCTVLGVVDVLWTIRKDQRELGEDNRWRLNVLKEHETAAEAIRAELLKGAVPDQDIKAYFAAEESIITRMRRRATEKQRSFLEHVFVAMQYVFLLSFFFGFIFLAIALFPAFEGLRF